MRALVGKELRELVASRSYWLLLIAAGVLTGQAFHEATSLYAEASGAGGGASALAQGLNPLTGIVAPTLAAYDLVSTLLLPFVVIRLFASERSTGSLLLMLQAPVRFGVVILAKACALLIGWLAVAIPGVLALALWVRAGGHLYAPEVLTVAAGYLFRGVLTIGLGAAAGALAESAASAAIIALSITIGSWAVDYAAAARGGLWSVVARYTPGAALRTFEHGELRVATMLVQTLLGITGLAIAAMWLRVGDSVRRRVGRSAVAAAAGLLLCAIAARSTQSWDTSEDRRNSFSAADEALLRRVPHPIWITAHLAAEDPRLADLDRGVIAKLRRVLPDTKVAYVSQGRSGLFERADPDYGEVWYNVAGRRVVSRSSTEEIVLDAIYEAAGLTPPATRDDRPYPGYPLRNTPAGGGLLFFCIWPLLVMVTWWVIRRPAIRTASFTVPRS